jgi:Right handed beta helix region
MPAPESTKRRAKSPVIRILGVALAAALLSLPAGTTAAATTTPATTGAYENTAPAITYAGAWRSMDSASDSGGSSSYLNSAGSASFTFAGTAVTWISRTTPSSGIAAVHIDGVKVADVDRYSSTTSYQKVVLELTGLSNAAHTLRIEWSGKANTASSGTNLMIDSIVVPDVVAPAKPTGVTAYNTAGNVAIKWNPVADDVETYRVYSLSSDGAYSLIGHTPKASTYFKVLGAPAKSLLTYTVTAVDAAGNESAKAYRGQVTTGVTPAGSHRYANCPAATTTVRTGTELMNAVSAAQPGNVILMAPGVYSGQMNLTTNGAAGKPIWICGPRDAVIDGGGITKGQSPIQVSSSSHLIVTGMTVTNGLKGVTVRSSHNITVSDMLVENIGYEAVHLRSNTTDSTVVGNTIRSTGLLAAQYGEGVYIGSSDANWCALTNCLPDTSDRNAVVSNDISLTGAEAIEGKEGTTGGIIRDNTINGYGAQSESWVLVSGNDWSVTSNTGTTSRLHGFRHSAHVDGWGLRNLFASNTATVNGTGYGFRLYEPKGVRSTRTLVSCMNTVNGATAGFSTNTCSR